jgi:phosphoheptose isomerase
MQQTISRYINEQVRVLKSSPVDQIEEVCRLFMEARKNGNSVFFAGNGGSAATASHFTNDMVKGLSVQGKKRFRAFCLCDQVSVITALGNDYSYEDIFSEQLKNYAGEGDILLVLSGSGNSPNVVKAVKYAASIGMKTIAFTGRDGGRVRDLCDLSLVASTWSMEQLEDMHLLWEHAIICALREEIEKEG